MAEPLPPTPPAPEPSRDDRRGWHRWRWPVLIGVVALATVGLLALLTNIFERQQEARNPFYRVVELTDTTANPATWGLNFPLHYDLYKRTVDQTRTRYGGSEAIPKQPLEVDPREVVAHSRLVEDPRLREFWAGYAFAEDFREERGHAYMFIDQLFTRRQIVAQQPGTCINCHASTYTAYLEAGDGDIMAGFEAINQMPYQEAAQLVEHPVSCIDCHDPESMRLRVTRPAFLLGMRALKASEGVEDYDVNVDASRLEMRTYTCAQCHVEYYFEGPEKRLTYPWSRGLSADSILAYYQDNGHEDWTHAISGAAALKAQHPEFELYSQGVHARSGVTCADCHMPYIREGAMKISDHWVRSPLLNLNNACQTCHGWSEEELAQRVHTIQDRNYEMRNAAIDATLQLAYQIRGAVEAGAPEAAVAAARDYQRQAQFLADFIEAENSMGFHADQEAMRILAKSINYARMGQAALSGVPVPDIPPALPSPPQTVTPLPARGAIAVQ
ncbi:MAG: ammonia-forming cytochrome c nitrite reductase subunit c552 [Rhodothermales bacterium]|nr:ammonia-forming cytochrome c nitrite reductase subunit c552 [Rhodothermales bacterium]